MSISCCFRSGRLLGSRRVGSELFYYLFLTKRKTLTACTESSWRLFPTRRSVGIIIYYINSHANIPNSLRNKSSPSPYYNTLQVYNIWILEARHLAIARAYYHKYFYYFAAYLYTLLYRPPSIGAGTGNCCRLIRRNQ